MQEQKVRMGKKQFRIGDLAQELKVKKFVIRFWEKEFSIKSDRSGGGQRFYTLEDFKLFTQIKDLLYNQGFTIAGAKKQLELTKGQAVTNASQEAPSDQSYVGAVSGELAADSDDDTDDEDCEQICEQDNSPMEGAVVDREAQVENTTEQKTCSNQEFVGQLHELREKLIAFKGKIEQS